MLGSRRALSQAPNFEPPLAGAPGDRVWPGGPVPRATPPSASPAALPWPHRHPSGCADAIDGAGQEGRRHTARRRSPHDGRSTSYASDETDSAAKRFAERSLRLVLEVLDGRRGAAQLRPLADPAVVAAVETLARTGEAGRRSGAAVLVAVNVVPTGPGAAEVFGGYERGRRRFAVAGRIAARRGEWRLTALHLR